MGNGNNFVRIVARLLGPEFTSDNLADGVEDWTLTFNAFFDSGVAQIDETLFGITITGSTTGIGRGMALMFAKVVTIGEEDLIITVFHDLTVVKPEATL